MSGIIGIHRAQAACGPQVLEPTLRRMASALAHRGPDGRGFWAEPAASGPGVALGHLALHATPEAHLETLPLRSAEPKSLSLVLTCDARLDNRAELLAELSPELAQVLGQPLADELLAVEPLADELLIDEPVVCDSALILAAYARWNRHCAAHLLGDFAFAIWDGRAGQLFCARDHVGVKPFYYFHDGGLFAFASEIKALFEVPGIGRRVDQARLAKYLMVAFDAFDDTAFEGIRRLPAAHTLTLSARGLEIERYWDLKAVPMLRGLCDREYEDRFREALFEAVRCRMRAPQSQAEGQPEGSAVGGFLSGGLDSSAVMCVAREVEQQGRAPRKLPVFSAIFDEVPECDERPFIDAVLAMGGLEPHWIRGEARSPLMNLERVLWHTDEPVLGPNLCSSWTHYKPARAAGVRVLLDGHGGDETVGFGLPLLSELVQARAWRALWRELKALERNGFLEGGLSASQIMGRSLAHSLPPLRLARRFKHGLARRLNPLLKPLKPRGQSAALAEPQPPPRPLWKALLNEAFAQRSGAEAMHLKCQELEPRNTDGDRLFNEKTLSAPLQTLAFEELSKAAAANGVEARYPLWDKRLVELCLSLPPEQKLRAGWTRSILRRSLQGVLPREVQWRGSKVDFTPEAWHGLRAHDAPTLRRLADQELPFSSGYVDSAEAGRCARLILESEAALPGPSPLVVRAAALECWLRLQHAAEPGLAQGPPPPPPDHEAPQAQGTPQAQGVREAVGASW